MAYRVDYITITGSGSVVCEDLKEANNFKNHIADMLSYEIKYIDDEPIKEKENNVENLFKKTATILPFKR